MSYIKNSLRSIFKKSNNETTKKIPNNKTYYLHNLDEGNISASPKMSYQKLAYEAFMNNIIVNRSIGMIAKNAASAKLILYKLQPNGLWEEVNSHPAWTLIQNPNPRLSCTQFVENVITYLLISGNSYIYIRKNNADYPIEMQLLRPDRVIIVKNRDHYLYRYRIDNIVYEFPFDPDSGDSEILHIKNFHPLDDWYGLSSIEIAYNLIEQHNECIKWNKALLSNGARPSGALVLKNNTMGAINNEQFNRLKEQIDNHIKGGINAGRIMLLEGGMEWQDMSINPRDMDFIETKNGAARDIALALGVPPQMLGIKGDNTYSNMSEARIAFWEETVLPLLRNFCDHMSKWISEHFNEPIKLEYDADSISSLIEKREGLWANLNLSTFLTDEEKREMLGFGKKRNN